MKAPIFFMTRRHSLARARGESRCAAVVARGAWTAVIRGARLGRRVLGRGRRVLGRGRRVLGTGRRVLGTGRRVLGRGRRVLGRGRCVLGRRGC
jgi:hypothetical protein